jgi:AcrR family transcriptional regulator
MAGPSHRVIDETAAKLIAAELAESLRDELRALTARLTRADVGQSMTVGEVAARLGVARSTVYAHWRDWGGYKLGAGAKAAIRFEASALPDRVSKPRNRASDRAPQLVGRRRARGRALIVDAPRMPNAREEGP